MSEFKTHAVLCLSNWGGVAIEVSDTGEAVRYKWYEDKPSRWCKVYYNRKSEPYFKIAGRRYYLSEFMRV